MQKLEGHRQEVDALFNFLPVAMSVSVANMMLGVKLIVVSSDCITQLSVMDVSAQSTMKGAVKCDEHCELQNSVNQLGFEHVICFWDIPESVPVAVRMACTAIGIYIPLVCVCEQGCI